MRLAETVYSIVLYFTYFISRNVQPDLHFRIDQDRVSMHFVYPRCLVVLPCTSFGASRLHRRRFLERPRAGRAGKAPNMPCLFRTYSQTAKQRCTCCTRRARRTHRGWLNKPGPGLVLFFDLSYRTLAAGNPICRYTQTTSSHCKREMPQKGTRPMSTYKSG